jgi:hypothetical protein
VTIASAAAPVLSFDEETHVYRLDGRELVSVTSAIREAGLMPDEHWFTKQARRRGSAVHTACWYDDEGDLDPSSVAPEIRGYLDAWRKFKHESHWGRLNTDEDGRDMSAKEQRLWSIEGFAGTPDRVGELFTTNPIAPDLTILDIKTGPPASWHGPQTAGYAIAWSERTGIALHRLRRAGVHLRADGTYRLHPHTDRADFGAFRAAVVVANWRRAHGL